MKVLIADAINEKGIENLKEAAEVVVDTTITPEELANTIHEYEGIIVRSRTKLTKEVIDKADNLKIIARAGVGVDNIDLNAATEKGIMVVNSPESTSITVAEHTMGLLLSLARKSAIADKSVKEGKWEKKKFMGVELRNKTLGVIGMGRIGSQVVNRCKAFEMDAVAYDPYLPEEVAAQMGVELTDLETVLKKADFITIHVPLTPETKHLISTKEFEIMKQLMSHPEMITSKDDLIISVWGSESDAMDNNVEVYISFLRKKLKFLKSQVSIKVIRKVGYRLEVCDA